MSHPQHMQSGFLSNGQNTVNRRSHSIFSQINPNYAINPHQPFAQCTKQSAFEGAKCTKNAYALTSKENGVSAVKGSQPNSNVDDVVTKLNLENERLRRQLQKQKNHYQFQIGKLKKNIAMKDQLLDQCQLQIGNLKQTYQKFISQNVKPYQQNKQEILLSDKRDTSKKLQEKNNGGSQISNGLALIPLSIVPKRSQSLSHLPAQKSSKMSHGLMKRMI